MAKARSRELQRPIPSSAETCISTTNGTVLDSPCWSLQALWQNTDNYVQSHRSFYCFMSLLSCLPGDTGNMTKQDNDLF